MLKTYSVMKITIIIIYIITLIELRKNKTS